MLRDGHGIKPTARAVGVGIRTVQRRVEYLQQIEAENYRGIFFRNVRAYICPIHGKTTVYPCVACEASRGTTPPDASTLSHDHQFTMTSNLENREGPP